MEVPNVPYRRHIGAGMKGVRLPLPKKAPKVIRPKKGKGAKPPRYKDKPIEMGSATSYHGLQMWD